MVKTKFYVVVALLSLLAIVIGACTSNSEPSLSSREDSTINDLKVKNAVEAMDVALDYLWQQEPQNAPDKDVEWQKTTVNFPGPVGVVTKEFLSDDWTIRVSYAVLPLENAIYEVTVSNTELDWHWYSDVKADGTITVMGFCYQISEEEFYRGTCGEEDHIKETKDVAELMANPVYGTLVRTQGVVSNLGEFLCPCFELTSSGKTIIVWYDMMVENDGAQWPTVDTQGINNGDRVVVIGELKGEGGIYYSKGSFWASNINRV